MITDPPPKPDLKAISRLFKPAGFVAVSHDRILIERRGLAGEQRACDVFEYHMLHGIPMTVYARSESTGKWERWKQCVPAGSRGL